MKPKKKNSGSKTFGTDYGNFKSNLAEKYGLPSSSGEEQEEEFQDGVKNGSEAIANFEDDDNDYDDHQKIQLMGQREGGELRKIEDTRENVLSLKNCTSNICEGENVYAEADERRSSRDGNLACEAFEGGYDSELYTNEPLSLDSSSIEGRYQSISGHNSRGGAQPDIGQKRGKRKHGQRSPSGRNAHRYAALPIGVNGSRSHQLRQVDNRSPFLSSSSCSTTYTNLGGRSGSSASGSRRGDSLMGAGALNSDHVGQEKEPFARSRIGHIESDAGPNSRTMGTYRQNINLAGQNLQFYGDDSKALRKDLSGLRTHHENALNLDELSQIASHDEPVVMPGFPVGTMQGVHQPPPPPPYSPSRNRHCLPMLSDRCRFNCNWKMIALSLTLLTLILSSVIAYFGAVRFPSSPSAIVQQQPLLPPLTSDSSSEASSCLPENPVNPAFKDQEMTAAAASPPVSATAPYTPSPVQPLVLGEWFTGTIEPMHFWRSSIDIRPLLSHGIPIYQMNITFVDRTGGEATDPPGSKNIAVYGRIGQNPSITTYDWVHIVTETGEQRKSLNSAAWNTKEEQLKSIGRSKRGTLNSDMVVTIERALSSGTWFFAVLNAHESSLRTVRAVLAPKPPVDSEKDEEKSCLNNCNGNGKCNASGLCECHPKFTGEDCSISVCPVLCSGHGFYSGGVCHCSDSWKGPECQVRDDECEVLDCNGHGECREGVCLCMQGWQGTACEKRDCIDPLCSHHGECISGNCHCDLGWMGARCELRNEALFKCLPDCSGHGRFEQMHGKCLCDDEWTGRDCNITRCNVDCGSNGVCTSRFGGLESCSCNDGWTGSRCQIRTCAPECEMHGDCVNGSCVCHIGWNGGKCSLEGCGKNADCTRHGRCQKSPGNYWANGLQKEEYRCICSTGWTGDFCQFAKELDCEDNEDNNGNGLIDCADSDCCSHPTCSESIMCVYLADPVEVLLRKPPPSISASFFQKVRFLFEGDQNVQSYVKRDTFIENQVSVLRGQVLTINGQGIIGVRVSVKGAASANYGFTLTRPGGWFDLAVNGGRSVTLQFQRSPLKTVTRTTRLAWNKIVALHPIVMTSYGTGSSDSNAAAISKTLLYAPSTIKYLQPCLAHDYDLMRPVFLSSYIPSLTTSSQSSSSGVDSTLLHVATRSLEERVSIPGSRLQLVHHSQSAPGANSILEIRLTPQDRIPRTMTRVYVTIRIAGRVFSKVLEAEAGLLYMFSWDKRNVYNQKVFGAAEATVSVGYSYETCSIGYPIWSTQMLKMRGFDSDISNVGKGWNIDVHHHYNFEQGLFRKGNGEWIDFSEQPHSIWSWLGSGKKRKISCGMECNLNKAAFHSNIEFSKVTDIVGAHDGSIFVADFNLIRKIDPNGMVTTVFKFSSSHSSYHYSLSISPFDGTIYLTMAEEHKIYKLSDSKLVRVAGTGERCVPTGAERNIKEGLCGDGGPGLEAQLDYPKSLVVDSHNNIYFADSRSIRFVSASEGRISTLMGQSHAHTMGPPRPLPCLSTFRADEIHLQWPTTLALNPIDESLYVVDDAVILKLTSDLRVKLIAGKSQECESHDSDPGNPNCKKATDCSFGPIQDIAFDSSGRLYVASKKPSTRKSVILTVQPTGQMKELELRQELQGQKSRTGSIPSQVEVFSAIAAIAVGADGTLRVADNAALKIFELKQSHMLKTENLSRSEKKDPGDVLISDHLYGEIYRFNRYGHHLSTYSLDSASTLFTFRYSKNTAFGKLTEVSDGLGNRLTLKRDYTNRVQAIENNIGKEFKLGLSRLGFLLFLKVNEDISVNLQYNEETGLLRSKTFSNGDFFAYEYERSTGRLASIVLPSGEELALKGVECPTTENEEIFCTSMRSGEFHDSISGDDSFIVSVGQFGSIQRLDNQGRISSMKSLSRQVSSYSSGGLNFQLTILGESIASVSQTLYNTTIEAQISALVFGRQIYLRRELALPNQPLLARKFLLSKNRDDPKEFGRDSPIQWNAGEQKREITSKYYFKMMKSSARSITDYKPEEYHKIIGIHFDARTGQNTVFNGQGQELLSVNYAEHSFLEIESKSTNATGQNLKQKSLKLLMPVAWNVGLFSNARSNQRRRNGKQESECQQSFDGLRRLTSRNCFSSEKDAIQSKMEYNSQNGKISSRKSCASQKPIEFRYTQQFDNIQSISYPSGRSFNYEYDKRGGLLSVTSSKESSRITQMFSVQMAMGRAKMTRKLPGFSSGHVSYHRLSDDAITKIRPPGNQGIRLSNYDAMGRLHEIVSGHTYSTFSYDGNSEWLSKVQHSSLGLKMNITSARYDEEHLHFKDGRAMFMEQRITFAEDSTLATSLFKYEMSREMSEVRIMGRIGGAQLPGHYVWGERVRTHGTTDRKRGEFYTSTTGLFHSSISDGIGNFERSKFQENFASKERKIFETSYAYDDLCNGDMISEVRATYLLESGEEVSRMANYKYDSERHLQEASLGNGYRDKRTYTYTYDEQGNMVHMITKSISATIEKHSLAYDTANRLKAIDGKGTFTFDELGRIIKDHKNRIFVYDSYDLLIRAQDAAADLEVEFGYDHLSRLVSRTTKMKKAVVGVLQYFYSFPSKPHLVSHVYRPHEGVLSTLIYDFSERLIFVDANNIIFYVISDRVGSPWLFMRPDSITDEVIVAREIRRSPLGKIESDKTFYGGGGIEDQHLINSLIPVGFRGGLVDHDLGMLHFQTTSGSRSYDPEIGNFLTPDWKNQRLEDVYRDPLQFFNLYRLRDNNPVNSLTSRFEAIGHTDLHFMLNKIRDPLLEGGQEFLNFINPLRTVQRSEGRDNDHQAINPLMSIFPHFELTDGIDERFNKLDAAFFSTEPLSPTTTATSAAMKFNARQQKVEFARAPTPLGSFVVAGRNLTGHFWRLSIAPVDKADLQTGLVLKQVLDGAENVDFTTVGTHGDVDVDVFFMVKNPIWSSSKDVAALRRLSANHYLNLTLYESENERNKAKVLDAKIHLPGISINIRYGTSRGVEKIRLLRHSLKLMARKSWARTRNVLARKRKGSLSPEEKFPSVYPDLDWNDFEVEQIIDQGYAENVELVFRRDVKKFPELANDLTNLRFRRKNNRLIS